MPIAPFVIRFALHVCVRDPRIVSGSTRRFLRNLLPLAALPSSLPSPLTLATLARAPPLLVTGPATGATHNFLFFLSTHYPSQASARAEATLLYSPCFPKPRATPPFRSLTKPVETRFSQQGGQVMGISRSRAFGINTLRVVLRLQRVLNADSIQMQRRPRRKW